jgi:hypothetical protein
MKNRDKCHFVESEAHVKHIRLLFLLGLLLSGGFLMAQEFTGRVTDATGAVLPKVAVTAHNVNTGVDIPTVTTSSGVYTIPYLKPGSYTVSAQAQGFETDLRTGITLQVDQTATVNFSLKVGSATETVTVNADPVLDLGKADVGEVVENTRVTELPLNGRDPGMLSILNAGAIWTGSIQWQRPFDDTQANLSVNGGGSGNTGLMLDGVSNTASTINNTGNAKIAYVPPVDSVQEFKIVSNPYDSKFGLMAGGMEDVTLKSGTNKIHGDVYEYARRTWLDANYWNNDWFISRAKAGTNLTPYKTPTMKWDQYGAELDGPVVLPKLYNGRDKTFFEMQYEKWHEVEPNTLTVSVPGSGWVNGDFSNLVYWNGSAYSPISILDPLSIKQNAQGTWVRTPFGPTDPVQASATNVIPASRINAMAQTMMKFYPAANTTTVNGSNPFASNYTTTGPDVNRYRNVLAKIDENLSARDRFSLHYGYWERVEVRNTNGLTGAAQEGQLPHGERSHTFTLEETHTFTPSLLFDFRANVSVRADYTFGGPAFDPTTLGWTAAEAQMMGPAAMAEFPYLDTSEFATMGTTGNSQTISNSFALFPTVTWIKSKHTIHAGLDARFQQSATDVIGGGNNFWIDRTWTQTQCGSCGSWDQASGNSIASILLGNPTSGSDAINTKVYWSDPYYAPFIQDDWKITHKLTLNLGVRWDLMPGEVERNNKGDYAFASTTVNPINSSVTVPGYSQILGGVTYLGVNGNPRAVYPLQKSNIQPRVGFAYAVDNRTVIRGGFGESKKSPQNAPNPAGYSSSTSYLANNPNYPGSVLPNLLNPLSNPYSSVVQPTGSSLGMLEQLGQGPWFLNPHYILPSFWNYSFGIERQFFSKDLLNITYVGSTLYNGDSSDNINHQNPAAYNTLNCNPELGGRYENCNNDNLPNPFKGVNGFQGSSDYTSSTINALVYTQPFPEFGGITEYQENDAHTWYNSLQVTGLHKMNDSLTIHGTFNFSKMMDSGGWRDQTYRIPYRQIDGNDHTLRATLSGVYQLPVGRGRMILPRMNRMVDTVVGGWELGSLYIFQSGAPWILPGNPNEVYLHNAYVKPHIQADNGYIRMVGACAEKWSETGTVYSLTPLAFDTDNTCPNGANFMAQPSFSPYPDNIYTGIRLLRNHQFDANLSKNFTILEGLKLQMRMEAFNVLNHPLWGQGPDGSTNDTTFGTIERGTWGQSNLPRQMQLSAKVVW